MTTFKHNGADIHYTVKGEGEPIVLIHGFGLDSRIWNKQVEELSKTNKVITYDLRGFGKSSLPSGRYSHKEDLNELLKHLKIESAKIVGHSFGGEIAVEYALTYPERVKSLVLVSPGLSGTSGDNTEWNELSRLGREGNIVGLKERIINNPMFKELRSNPETKELIEEIIQDYSGFHFTNRDPREYEDNREKIKDIDCPVTFILGEKEDKKVAEKFKEELGIEAEVIPGAGHMSMLEKPEVVSEAIKETNNKEFHSETRNLI
jgi:pimeloyl-ACP methyl ester carboxylesterase